MNGTKSNKNVRLSLRALGEKPGLSGSWTVSERRVRRREEERTPPLPSRKKIVIPKRKEVIQPALSARETLQSGFWTANPSHGSAGSANEAEAAKKEKI